jgi:hypothetical protein
MALKRINKELTDLGRYVVPEFDFQIADSPVPSFDCLRLVGLSLGGVAYHDPEGRPATYRDITNAAFFVHGHISVVDSRC